MVLHDPDPDPAMAPSSDGPWWLRHITADEDGLPVALSWKCWRNAAGKRRWSVRPIMDSLLVPASLKVGRWFKDLGRLGFHDALRMLGLVLEAEIFPSRGSQTALGRVVGRENKQVWTMSTEAAVLVLLCFSTRARKRQVRVRAHVVLTAWLQRLAAASIQLSHRILQLMPNCNEVCARDGAGECLHRRRAEEWFGGIRTVVGVAGALDKALIYGPFCRTVQQQLRGSIFMIASMMEDEGADSLLFSKPVMSDLAFGVKRRRRIDEDVAEAMCMSKAGSATRAAYLSGGELAVNTGTRMDAKQLQAYLLGATDAYANGINYCLQADGGRVGKPAENTYFFSLWSQQARRGGPLIPQVWSSTVSEPRARISPGFYPEFTCSSRACP